MEHLEDERQYAAQSQVTGDDNRPPLSWLPEYRLGHTLLLVVLTGIAGWYAFYRVAVWLLELLN